MGHFVVLSTVVEMGQWYGHMWMWKPGRTLPLWSIWGDGVAQELEKRPWFINTLSLVAVATLLFSPWYGISATVLLLVCTVDYWRLAYMHYWLLALFALADSQAAHSFDLSLIVGFLYFYAGLFKLISAEFYAAVAPVVFDPIFRALRLGSESSIRWWVSFLGVLGEAMLGVLILFSWLLPSEWRVLVAMAVVAFHLYIIIFIGVMRGIRTFVSWNAFCCCTSVYVCTQSAAPHLTFTSVLIGAVMLLPPLFRRVRVEYPTFAHAYFVPQPVSFGLAIARPPPNSFAEIDTPRHQRCVKDRTFSLLSSEWVDMTFTYDDGEFDECNECFTCSRDFWAMVGRRFASSSPPSHVVRM